MSKMMLKMMLKMMRKMMRMSMRMSMRMMESGVSKRSMMHCALPTASMQPGFLFNTRSQLLQEFASFSFRALHERRSDQVDSDREMSQLMHSAHCQGFVRYRG